MSTPGYSHVRRMASCLQIRPTFVLCSIFLVSGASALLFESLWLRQAGLAFGNSVWASCLVLSAFMAGLALGNAAAARYGDRLGDPIRAYAIAELGIAVTGVGLVYALPGVGVESGPWLQPLLDQPWLLNVLRFLVAFLLLLLPSVAMGLTLPMLAKALGGIPADFGTALGRLYGWNTLGAVIGVVLGEIYLIEAYGVRGTALAAGALNLIAASAAILVATRFTYQSPPPPRPNRRHQPRLRAEKSWLVAAFLSGCALLALEVVWFRFLLLFVEGYSDTFAVMLAVVLSGVALGGLAASQWFRLSPRGERLGAPLAFLMGAVCALSYSAFPSIVAPFTSSPDAVSDMGDLLRLSIPLMLPVSFLSGAFFAVAAVALRKAEFSATESAGLLTLANTTGAAIGSLTAGFVLLPLLGMERSFFLIILVYGTIGVVLLRSAERPRTAAYLASAGFLSTTVLFPFGSMKSDMLNVPIQRYVRDDPAVVVSAVREGLTETNIYFTRLMLGKPLSHQLVTNSFSMSGTAFGARRYMKLFFYWPMAVHPDLRQVLLIAYGVGNTAKAMTDAGSLESIDVVDISRDILDLDPIVYPNESDRPLQDSRVRVHVEDGRYFLQTTDRRFDLITGEPPPPGMAGVVNLYTREYFQLLFNRLEEGGLVTYWLPLSDLSDQSAKAILRAFCDVFEDCSLWNGQGTNLMLAGTRNAQPVSEAQFARQWNDPAVAGEMKDIGVELPEQLGALFIGDAEYLKALTGGVLPLVDNYPKRIDARALGTDTHGLLQSVTDVAGARERFRHSPFIRRLWPQRTAAASLRYFEFQGLINSYFYDHMEWPPPLLEDVRVLGEVHRLLTQSPLTTLALWRLGSDWDIQRIVAAAEPAESSHPAVQAQLGLRLLSERKYAEAEEALAQAEALPAATGDEMFRLRLYALCLSGNTGRARQLARERTVRDGSPVGGVQSPFWAWMKQTFGVDLLG
jgi:spermidine synthase